MQTISQTKHNQETTETNGHVKQDHKNGKKAEVLTEILPHSEQTQIDHADKVVLPVEMASMVPLRVLIGKMVRKSHADLMTLTDTLPSMSDVERKRQILNFATFARKQFLKLSVLVKWAENANDIQMCQNIMAHLANQNKIFQDTSDYLHKIHVELPAARTRNYDVKTAVDVLTTGTYQRMPTKIKDMVPPACLTDEEVLETFQKMNDVIRVRLLTTEVLPSPMLDHRIENGRIYFSIENEFKVSLTLMGPSNARQWWIVSLDVLVQTAEGGGGAADVDISFNDMQQQHLRSNAQRQLAPPTPLPPKPTEDAPVETIEQKPPLFFPIVNLYDYLHMFCLNMQLEIVYMQAAMLARTRWVNQLKVHMDSARTKLTLSYWGGGSPAAHWACPQPFTTVEESQAKSTVIEIMMSNEDEKRRGKLSQNDYMVATIRDEFKGLIQKAGIGASVALADINASDRPKVVSALKYPKTQLDLKWGDCTDLHTKDVLFNPTDLSAERLLLHVTRYHGECIIEKIRKVLKYQEKFLEENGLHLAIETNDDVPIGDVKLEDEQPKAEDSTLIVRYRHERYISIDVDTRTGLVRICEVGHGYGEGDVKLKNLEEKINNDPINTAQHLLWLRSEIVVREIVSLAKQLRLQPYHPAQMNLRPDDIAKLFSDIPPMSSPKQPEPDIHYSPKKITSTDTKSNTSKQIYPTHCIFLQFLQFEDWYFVVAIVNDEFQAWLCCLSKVYDQNGLYQTITDLIHIDYKDIWSEQFYEDNDIDSDVNNETRKRRREQLVKNQTKILKRRKTLTSLDELLTASAKNSREIDNLSINLRFMAKLDSLCRKSNFNYNSTGGLLIIECDLFSSVCLMPKFRL
ncbi:mediator complex subunit MED14-domain-containing protein [Phycomyces blakesleeanus]